MARTALAFFFLTFTLSPTLPIRLAAEEVTVVTTAGRALEAEVDERSNSEALWLRFTAPGIVLRRSIAWNQVAAARVGDAELTAEELQMRLDEFATALPADYFDQASRQQRLPEMAPSIPPRVTAIQASAQPANWDRDAEIDGLELVLTAVDEQGSEVAVQGRLLVSLVGRRHFPRSHSDTFPVLDRWSLSVDLVEDAVHRKVHRLPFRHTHPEADTNLSTHGLLHVMLIAHGHGNFEAEVPVFLRDYNPIRSQMLFQPQAIPYW